MITRLIDRFWRRRQDAGHIGATEADGIGVIPAERTIDQIAADGMTDDERRDARLAAWFAYDYDAWVLERGALTHHSTHTRQMRSEARCERAIDRALRKFGSSLAMVAAEKMLASCHGDLGEMAEKANRPVAIDETAEWVWTEADDRAVAEYSQAVKR